MSGRTIHPAMWAAALTVWAWAMPCAASDPAIGETEATRAAATANEPVQVDALTRLAEKLATAEPENDAEARRGGQSAAAAGADAAVEPPATGEDRPLGLTSPLHGSRPLGPDGEAVRDGGWVLSTLASLGVVIGLILLARWGWSKMGGAVAVRGSAVVEVLSRTTVAPRNHVLLLRVGGRVLVVGDSTAGLRTLASIEDPDEVAGVLEAVTAARGNSISRGFSQLLSHTERDFGEQDRLAAEGGDEGEYRLDQARDSVSSLLSRIRAMSQKGGV